MALAAFALWLGPVLIAPSGPPTEAEPPFPPVAAAVRDDGPSTESIAGASTPALYEHVAKTYGPAVVTIRFVQKTQGRFGDMDNEEEINGTMIEANGLVLCSNLLLGAGAGRRGGRSVPTDIRVLVGEDVQGRPARFVARDSELDLAWLRIDGAADRTYSFVDLEAAARRSAGADRLRRGERVVSLALMGRYFGQAVLVTEGQIAGRTRKPRELYVVRGGLDTDPGLPVLDAQAEVIGLACLQQPSAEEVSGNSANLLARGRGLVLPVEAVYKATLRAKEIEAEERAEEPPAPEEEPEMAPDSGTSGEEEEMEEG